MLALTLPSGTLPLINDAAVTQGYAARRYITDVTEYTPYYQDILYLYRTGLSQGSGESALFSPDAIITRGALAAMLGIDEVVAIGAKAEKIADGAAQSGGSVTHFATKEEAVHELTDQLGTDTAMLVKASHAMHFGWIVEQLKQAYD